jgi:hypothetical protein
VQKQQQEYFNFINSLNSEYTKKQYSFHLQQFLNYSKLDMHSFLKLSDQEITNIIIKYLLQKKVSKTSKDLIFFAIKHLCVMNDVILNWTKIKKFLL